MESGDKAQHEWTKENRPDEWFEIELRLLAEKATEIHKTYVYFLEKHRKKK